MPRQHDADTGITVTSRRHPHMTSLPSGTVTFLFTDIEGSTRLWDDFPEDM